MNSSPSRIVLHLYHDCLIPKLPTFQISFNHQYLRVQILRRSFCLNAVSTERCLLCVLFVGEGRFFLSGDSRAQRCCRSWSRRRFCCWCSLWFGGLTFLLGNPGWRGSTVVSSDLGFGWPARRLVDFSFQKRQKTALRPAGHHLGSEMNLQLWFLAYAEFKAFDQITSYASETHWKKA